MEFTCKLSDIRKYLIIFLVFPVFGFTQEKYIGTPHIRNYEKSEYSAGTQNWNIAQDKDGFMYFANNDGVLRFDGFHWELIPVPSSLVRSVFIDSNNNIYAALSYDFGCIQRNSSGKYEFKSLLDLVPERHRDFDEVWKIHEIDGNIIFQSFEKIFIYDGVDIQIVVPQNKFHFSFNIAGKLYYQDLEVGLFTFVEGRPVQLNYANSLKNSQILSITELDADNLLIGTADKGLFYYDGHTLTEWDTDVNTFIKTNKLFCATQFANGNLAFGTILNGVVIADANGEVLHIVNRGKELQNNTVLSVFPDKDNNLWLGLDNGISYVETNSPITYLTGQGTLGTGYSAKIYNNKLYLGTNQGLFMRSYESRDALDADYKLVENSEGQVWFIEEFDNQLLCGHNNGTYLIRADKAELISDEPGAWGYIRLKNQPDLLLGGHYHGLVVLKKGARGWEYSHKLKGFNESSRFIKQDKGGDIWMSHGGKGVFRMSLNEKADSVVRFSRYGKAQGLPSDRSNLLFELNDELYVSTVDGVFTYQTASNSFVEAEAINELFGLRGQLQKVVSDEEENVWYISETESGVLRKNEDLTYTKITSPFDAIREQFVSAFEFIYPLDEQYTIFGIDQGFVHYNSKFSKSYNADFQSFITKVELSYLDSVIYPLGGDAERFNFPFRKNSIRFHYNSPFYENLKDLRFSYYLENFSDQWSPWTADFYKDFTNLPFGDYTFKIKALNNYGKESGISEFSFSILPPWYRSNWAHFLYVIFLLVSIVVTILVIQYRIKQREKQARVLHQKEMQEKDEHFQHQAVIAEKEIIKLRNEKLRAEMIYRDKELANQTNNIIHKNRFLMKVNQELQKIQNTTEDGAVKSKMAVLKRRIEKELDDKQQNRIFETYFDEVHKEFFERLKEKFPQLSPKDLRLCAYIRMNISTKEIATLLNISFRGVEISRYRLRKKLELSRSINLSTYLSNI